MATSEHEKERNRVKQRRWLARHAVELEMARQPIYHAPRRVVALWDGDRLQWVESVGTGETAYWRKLLPFRDTLDTPLARWLRSLPAEPQEQTVFERLDATTARRLAAFLMRDASCAEPVGRSVGRRTIIARPDGRVDVFPSIAAALESVGLWRFDGRRHVGRTLPDGAVIL